MNAYDHKHHFLLTQIASGDWRRIPEADIPQLKVLMVCKYVRIETGAAGVDQIVITSEGQHYFSHLCALSSMNMTRRVPFDGVTQTWSVT